MRLQIVSISCLIIIAVLSGCAGYNWENEQKGSQAINSHQKPVIKEQQEPVPLFKPEPLITPGQYTLEAPKAKTSFIVWVPYDYKPDFTWPVIFCYHGAGGSMTTWPFQQVTRGFGYIIVGMSYIPHDPSGRSFQWLNKEKEFFFESLDMVSARLNVDPKMIFMGGYSQGGYHTTLLGEQVLDKLAGLIVLGAGRFFIAHTPPPPSNIHGKPVFIGVGENDTTHNPRAKKAAENYKSWGAKVTFEEWPGVGHGISTPEFPSKLLLSWLEEIFAEPD